MTARVAASVHTLMSGLARRCQDRARAGHLAFPWRLVAPCCAWRRTSPRRRSVSLPHSRNRIRTTVNTVSMSPFVPPADWVARVVARRGRLHAFERIEPARCALLVVDMQNSFVKQGAGHAWVPAAAATCPAIEHLAAGLRDAGGTVVWVLNTFTPESAQSWSHFHRDLSTPLGFERRSRSMAPGHEGHALYADLHPHPQDLQVPKTRYSAFVPGSSDLHERLQARRIDTVLIAGTATNVCCESTGRDAMMLDYRTVMVSDACSASTQAEHEASLCGFLLNFGDVQTVEEVLAALRPGI
jgi:ureidoacrylate peracid hydrolase